MQAIAAEPGPAPSAQRVLFVTVWHYSVLRSALANTPGPLLVLVVARLAGRAADQVGFRIILLAGAVVWTVGNVGFAVETATTPTGYLTGCHGSC